MMSRALLLSDDAEIVQQARARDLRRRRPMRPWRDLRRSSTRICSSTARRAAFRRPRRRALLVQAFLGEAIETVEKRGAARGACGSGRALAADRLTCAARPGERTMDATIRSAGIAPYDLAEVRADFPRCAKQRLWQAARLSRQRRLGPEAARRDRPHGARLRDTNTPTCIAACTSSPMRRPRPMRARARRSAPSSTRPRPTRSSSRARRPRRSTSSPHRWAAARDRRGRRDRPLDHGAPFQHRALAFPARAQGAVINWAPVRR